MAAVGCCNVWIPYDPVKVEVERSVRALLTEENNHSLKEFAQRYKTVFLIFKHKNGFTEKYSVSSPCSPMNFCYGESVGKLPFMIKSPGGYGETGVMSH
jgi:hypothetical protein